MLAKSTAALILFVQHKVEEQSGPGKKADSQRQVFGVSTILLSNDDTLRRRCCLGCKHPYRRRPRLCHALIYSNSGTVVSTVHQCCGLCQGSNAGIAIPCSLVAAVSVAGIWITSVKPDRSYDMRAWHLLQLAPFSRRYASY